MTRINAVGLLCAGLALAAGCDTPPAVPTSPTTPAATSATQVFSGTLAPGDTPLFDFTVPATAALHLTFGSLTDAAGMPIAAGVTLVFGLQPATGDGCDLLTRVPVTAQLKAQINVTVSAAAYCVGLEDTSGVPGSVNFSIRAIYGTPSDATSSGTIPYSSVLLPGGSTVRSFDAAAAGVATITMETFAPASVSTLGLGLGFPRNDGSGCEISQSTIVTRGQEFSMPMDAGRYCVKVFDPGTLTGQASFVLRILHP